MGDRMNKVAAKVQQLLDQGTFQFVADGVRVSWALVRELIPEVESVKVVLPNVAVLTLKR